VDTHNTVLLLSLDCCTAPQQQVVYEDLDIGEVIGRGCSSIVCFATHGGTGTPLALKVGDSPMISRILLQHAYSSVCIHTLCSLIQVL
jgi:hypothetical protein